MILFKVDRFILFILLNIILFNILILFIIDRFIVIIVMSLLNGLIFKIFHLNGRLIIMDKIMLLYDLIELELFLIFIVIRFMNNFL